VPEPSNQISSQGLAELKRELDRLEGQERQTLVERIKVAREFGDLKENAEYHDARHDRGLLEGRILMLRSRISDAVVVETPASSNTARFGSTVVVTGEDGSESTFTLVGSSETDLQSGRVSIDSPVGKALVGTRAGDAAQIEAPRGRRQLTVVSVS
jgi:transcription elongation factor GreA